MVQRIRVSSATWPGFVRALTSALVGCLLLLGVRASPAMAACTAGTATPNLIETTPTGAFTDHGDGTVTHHSTGLMWKKCLEGASGTDCQSGAATAVIGWSTALQLARNSSAASYTDWRIPNLADLLSILERCGWGPALNQEIFPSSTPVSEHVWSATSKSSVSAWLVDFFTGQIFSANKATGGPYVRLVRGGSGWAKFDAQLDAVPDAFNFNAVTAALNVSYTSNNVALSGLGQPTGIAVSGGEYAAGNDCGGAGGMQIAWGSAPSMVGDGDTVCVRHVSSVSLATLTTTTLTVGGVNVEFSSTTVTDAADLNLDGTIDSLDLGVFMSRWGSADVQADLNGNGVVDSGDLELLLRKF